MARGTTRQVHPWDEAALAWGREARTWAVVRYRSREWSAWAEYFHRIGYLPASFAMLSEHHAEWTAPVQWPAAFDMTLPPFKARAVPNLAHKTVQPRQPPPEVPGMYANMWVAEDNPHYAAMVARAEGGADHRDWCLYRDHPRHGTGIKVPLPWYWQAVDRHRGATQLRPARPPAHDIARRLAIAERMAAPSPSPDPGETNNDLEVSLDDL